MGKVKEGNEVARWKRWEGNAVARWGRWENGKVGHSWLYSRVEDAGLRVSPRFHLFVSDVNQGKE